MLLIFFFFIMIFLMILNYIFSKKMFKNREKMSSFECGFDSFSSNRLPFSLQFFLISVIFLIFDIEIALILPMIFFNNYFFYVVFITFFLILILLLIGLYMEWVEGALKWFK